MDPRSHVHKGKSTTIPMLFNKTSISLANWFFHQRLLKDSAKFNLMLKMLETPINCYFTLLNFRYSFRDGGGGGTCIVIFIQIFFKLNECFDGTKFE